MVLAISNVPVSVVALCDRLVLIQPLVESIELQVPTHSPEKSAAAPVSAKQTEASAAPIDTTALFILFAFPYANRVHPAFPWAEIWQSRLPAEPKPKKKRS
jgi:hypothetical protein